MEASDKAKCEAWVKAHASSWQVLNRSQWKYQFRGKAMVRFVEESGMREDEVKRLLEFLSSDECIATLSLYDQAVSGDWKPIRAWYEVSNKSHGSIHAVRLYHGLQTDPAETDGGTYVVENGCAYKVEIRYVWNASSVETVRPGTSGVSYRIEGISQDPETGLFSYAVEKRERVQQDIEEYLAERSVFADVKIEQHTGVKGANTVGGKQASVGGGKRVRRRVRKNADCTHDVDNETIEEKNVPEAVVEYHKTLRGTRKSVTNRGQAAPLNGDGMKVGESRSTRKTDGGLHDNTVTTQTTEAAGRIAKGAQKTVFEESTSERENVAAGGILPEAETSEAGGGIVNSVDVALNEDGSADVTRRQRKEKQVSEASERVSVTLDGTRTTTVNRGMGAKASAAGLDIGESVENEKTEGGLWKQTITKRTPSSSVNLGGSESDTAFSNVRTSAIVQSAPATPTATAAGGGQTHRKSVSRTESGGYRVETTDTQEKRADDAAIEVRRTLKGTTTTMVKRGQPAPLDGDDIKIGETRSSRKTEGGLYDNTTTETKVPESDQNIAREKRKTIFEESEATRKTVNADGALPSTPEADDPSNGEVHSVEVSLNENGTADVTERKRKEKPVSEAVVEYHKTLRGTRKSVTNRNQADALNGDGLAVGERRVSRKTEGGLYDNTTESAKADDAAGRVALAESDTLFEHTKRSVESVKKGDAVDDGDADVEDAADGLTRRKEIRRNEDGATAEVITTETKEKTVSEAVVTKRKTIHGMVTRTESRGQSEKLPDPLKVGESVTNTKTPGGLYTTVKEEHDAEGGGTISESATKNYFSDSESETSNDTEYDKPEVAFEDGKVVKKSCTDNGDGTFDKTTHTIKAKPRKNQYKYRRADDSYVHVIRYWNQESKNVGYDEGAEGLVVHDTINEFGLHDGTVTWLSNVKKLPVTVEQKFTKHGATQTFYVVGYNRRKRRFYHKTMQIQLTHICGDAYTDYLNDKMGADINRTTSGILCTRLIRGPYQDKDGNVVAEWEYVRYNASGSDDWTACTSNCKHGMVSTSREEVAQAALKTIGNQDVSSDARGELRMLARVLENLPAALAAALNGKENGDAKPEEGA